MAAPLTRVLSLALRHKPELFGLTIDNAGWTSLSDCARTLGERFPALLITEDSLAEYVAGEPLQRFEIRDGWIRALYGHSLSHVQVGEVAEPPPLLFHATQAILLPRIRKDGLTGKGRNGAHLTASWPYAVIVRDTHSREGRRGVMLAVETEKTRLTGIVFFKATEHIWLSPYIPARFLSLVTWNGSAAQPGPPGTLVPLDNQNNRAILQSRLRGLIDGEDVL